MILDEYDRAFSIVYTIDWWTDSNGDTWPWNILVFVLSIYLNIYICVKTCTYHYIISRIHFTQFPCVKVYANYIEYITQLLLVYLPHPGHIFNSDLFQS